MYKILFLYSELGSYMTGFLEKLSEHNMITCVYWNSKLLRPSQTYESSESLVYIPRDVYDFNIDKFDLVYVAGWMDIKYLNHARILKKNGAKIIAGFDDRYLGTLKQRLGVLVIPWIKMRCFDYAWVSGFEQWHYARRIGFRAVEIRPNLLSANYDFEKRIIDYKVDGYFLFVGTMRSVKGIDLLFKAYEKYLSNGGKRALVVCGNNLDGMIIPDYVKYYGFQDTLGLCDIYSGAACLVVPSRSEQWGVVINEAAIHGLPIIATEVVGSIGSLVIEGYNGLLTEVTSDGISKRLSDFDEVDNLKKKFYSRKSQLLANRFLMREGVDMFLSFASK